MLNVPNSELARLISYLGGFALGLVAVAAAIYVIVTDPERMDLFSVLVGLGASLMGMGGLATYNVPSVKPRKPEQAEPVPAIATDPGLVERVTTGEVETVVVDPIELTRNPESERRGDPGVVYVPDAYKDTDSMSEAPRGKYGKHE